ncbi:MAG: outer membrane protein assembly factor BamA [Thermodesulfobacteriota bacterium]
MGKLSMLIRSCIYRAAFAIALLLLLTSLYNEMSFGQDSAGKGLSSGDVTKKPESATGAQTPENPQEQTIVQIKIEGNVRVEKDLIGLNISSKVGEPLSNATVRDDIKRLYKLGFFEDVSTETEQTPGGVVLIYSVKEKPVVSDLRIRGNKAIKSDKILEVVEVKEGRIIDLNKVKKSQEAISALYAKNGLVGTVVDYKIEPQGEGTVSVTYDIKEGKKAYIKKVGFIGNEKLKTKVIKKGLYSKPKGMFSFLSKKGIYNPQEIDNDTERIRATYIDNGFLDVRVSKPEVEYSNEKKGYIITFKIDEGNQYKVAQLQFVGDLMVPEEKLRETLKLKSGEIFRGSLLAQDISGLTTFYGDKGYAFANVEPKFNLDREKLTVDVTFKIEKGTEVYVRKIDIVGNTRTRDRVIRREIQIQEDQLYNATKVQSIKSRVVRLGFFEDNVEVATERVPGTDNQIDMNVKVKEKPTGFFSIAGGFSSVETFIFAGQVQEANLFGYGKRLTFNAQIGGVTQLFYLEYQDPHFQDTNYTLDALVFHTKRDFQDFSRNSWGGSVTVGKYLWKNLSGDITNRFEDVTINGVSADARLLIPNSNQTIVSQALGFGWDTRNNLLDPSAGNLSVTNIEYAGPLGNTEFVKYNLSSRQWFPLWYKTVLTIRGTYGLLGLINNGNNPVVSERYFLGGPNDLRGYPFRRVGPRVPAADGSYVIIGGVQQLVFSADYVFPIMPSAGLKGVVFFDMGNAFNDGQKLSINPWDGVNGLRPDVGLGVRWISPIGPLRLEFGFPLGTRQNGENSYQIQFTIGTLF